MRGGVFLNKTAMKEMMKQNEFGTENEEYYTDGNTVIRVKEYFPKTGKTAAELIEQTVCYESRMTDSKNKQADK